MSISKFEKLLPAQSQKAQDHILNTTVALCTPATCSHHQAENIAGLLSLLFQGPGCDANHSYLCRAKVEEWVEL